MGPVWEGHGSQQHASWVGVFDVKGGSGLVLKAVTDWEILREWVSELCF